VLLLNSRSVGSRIVAAAWSAARELLCGGGGAGLYCLTYGGN
jgi:hypothetical protein